jgi:hypothetical protein
MTRLFHEIGRPMDLYFYLPLKWSGRDPVLLSKMLGVTAWIASAVCAYAVLCRLGNFQDELATATAVIMATLPIFDILGDLAIWMNTACVLLFWLSWLGVSYLQQDRLLKGVVIRCASLIGFFLSFNLNSNLVFFYAFCATIAACRARSSSIADARRLLQRTVSKNIDFLLLPLIFWFWKTWFTPTAGFHTNYNQPSLDVIRLLAGYLGVAINFVFPCAYAVVTSPFALLASLAAAAAIIYILNSSSNKIAKKAIPDGSPLFLWCMGLMLLLASAFPYLVVGQPLGSEGWITRNCILSPLPLSLMIVAVVLEANRRWAPKFPRAWLLAVVTVAAGGVGACLENYLQYQAFGMKQLAIQHALSDVIDETGAAVIQLRDYAPIPSTIVSYPPIIWSFIASHPPRPPQTLVVETTSFAPDHFLMGSDGATNRVVPRVTFDSTIVETCIQQTLMPYAFAQVPRQGTQALVAVHLSGGGGTLASQAIRYMAVRWFSRSGASDFVRRFLSVERILLPNVQ